MNETTLLNTCPKCGAALPSAATSGLCPRCLMAEAMLPTELDPALSSFGEIVTPSELAPHFPQLEILECLGRGGMGVVYKARQKTLNRLVALKLLAPERAHDTAFAERFVREAQALAALNHPSIVTIYDFGQAGGFFFLLMEFVDGVNLRQAMKAGRFTPEQALAIVPPVCEALQYAHEHGIVHRDIKPENLLLDKEGRVKIADFGIAKIIGRDADTPVRSEGMQTGVSASLTAGTPQYMAPEQKEHRVTDHRADIYSLGVVLYEMLTGERPKEDVVPPSKRVQVDVRIDEIVLRALEKTPELRFATAAEFRTQVENLATPAGVESRSLKPWERSWLAWPEGKRAFLQGALFLLVLALTLGFGWIDREVVVSAPNPQTGAFQNEVRIHVGAGQPWLVEIERWTQDGRQSWPEFRSGTPSFFCGPAALAVWILLVRLVRVTQGPALIRLRTAPDAAGRSHVLWPNVFAAWLGAVAVGSLGVLLLIAAMAAFGGGAPPAIPSLFLSVVPVSMLVFVGLRLPAAAKGVVAPPAASVGNSSPPRFSRMAIFGAVWFGVALVGILTIAGPIEKGLPWWQVLLSLMVLLPTLSAPFGTTILGWIAVSQIRRSAGKISGLGLAVFDGLLFPLLLLDGVIVWVLIRLLGFFVEFHSNFSNLNNPQAHPPFITRLANHLSQNHELVLLIAVLGAIVLDFLIIRRVWRKVNQPLAGSDNSDQPKPTSGQTPASETKPTQLGKWAVGFFIGAAVGVPLLWGFMGAQEVIVLCGLALLLSLVLGLMSWRSNSGKFAALASGLGLLLWVAFAFNYLKPRAPRGPYEGGGKTTAYTPVKNNLFAALSARYGAEESRFELGKPFEVTLLFYNYSPIDIVVNPQEMPSAAWLTVEDSAGNLVELTGQNVAASVLKEPRVVKSRDGTAGYAMTLLLLPKSDAATVPKAKADAMAWVEPGTYNLQFHLRLPPTSYQPDGSSKYEYHSTPLPIEFLGSQSLEQATQPSGSPGPVVERVKFSFSHTEALAGGHELTMPATTRMRWLPNIGQPLSLTNNRQVLTRVRLLERHHANVFAEAACSVDGTNWESQILPLSAEVTKGKLSFQNGTEVTVELLGAGIASLSKPPIPSFGSVIERELMGGRRKLGIEGLNFTSGKVIKAESKDLPDDELLVKWLNERGVDLVVAHAGSANWVWSTPPDVDVASLPQEQWDQATPEHVSAALNGGTMKIKHHGLKELPFQTSENSLPTFAFRAKNRAAGLLQITGVTENPPGVKIRYKLAQPADPLEPATSETDAGDGSWADHFKHGEVRRAQEGLEDALASYRRSLEAAQDESKRRPQDAGRQTVHRRRIKQSLTRIGDVLCAQGDLAGALENYRAAKANFEPLVRKEPADEAQRNELVALHVKIGDVLDAQGDKSGALASFRRAQEVNFSVSQTWEEAFKSNGGDYNPTTAFKPEELRHLAANPKSHEDFRRLMWLINRAGAEKDAGFRYLLDKPELRKNEEVNLALIGYDYSVNGNPKALDELLAKLARERVGSDSSVVVALSFVDEWDRVPKAVKSHFSETDGAGATCHVSYKIKSAYYFPRNSLKHEGKAGEGAPLNMRRNK